MDLVTYPITRDGADRLLVLLHGWSAEQHHLAAYVPLVDPDERFTATCPRAPHDLPEGDGASWYERDDAGPEAKSYLAAVEAVHDLVDDTMTRLGIGPERTVVGGFSQGGFIALSTALRPGAPRYAGVWAMCSGLADVRGLDHDVSPGSGGGRTALVQFGERDEIITPDRGRAAAATLESAGWQVTARGYDMAHSQSIEMMVDARSWLAAVR